MSIPLPLLALTESQAVGIVTYGGPGLNKTLAIRTLPPPILMMDFEGGTGSLIPWTRRSKQALDGSWVNYTQEQRAQAFSLLPDNFLEACKYTPPAPLIDIIHYNSLDAAQYSQFMQDVSNINKKYYSSIAIDPLQEFSVTTQSFSKGEGNEQNPMELKLWAGAQERAAIAIRVLRGIRKEGMFYYITGGENIDKDYAVDPRSKIGAGGASGPPEQPYLIKGSIDVPGKLVGVVTHACDIMLRARIVNSKPTFVALQESLPGGAWWECKDRFGRLPAFNPPNFKLILSAIYGKEGAKEIYAHGNNIIAGA